MNVTSEDRRGETQRRAQSIDFNCTSRLLSFVTPRDRLDDVSHNAAAERQLVHHRRKINQLRKFCFCFMASVAVIEKAADGRLLAMPSVDTARRPRDST
jgi:hypothetical protein